MKYATFLLAGILGLSAAAQTSIQLSNHTASVVLAPNATINIATVPEDVVKVTLDIKNISSTTKSYKAIRYDVKLHATPNATASAYFCFAGTCFPADTDTAETALVLDPNQSASDVAGLNQMLEADLYETEKMGLSIVKYTFFNVNDPKDSVQVTLKYNDATTGLVEATARATRFRLYPNPNSGGFLSVIPSANVEKIEIYNILGSVVYTSAGSSVVDLGGIAPGNYFVKIFNGQAVQTERLVISK